MLPMWIFFHLDRYIFVEWGQPPLISHFSRLGRADHVHGRTPQQAIDTGTHPRPQPSLLLDCHQLQEERTRGEDADEPPQEGLDAWFEDGRFDSPSRTFLLHPLERNLKSAELPTPNLTSHSQYSISSDLLQYPVT